MILKLNGLFAWGFCLGVSADFFSMFMGFLWRYIFSVRIADYADYTDFKKLFA